LPVGQVFPLTTSLLIGTPVVQNVAVYPPTLQPAQPSIIYAVSSLHPPTLHSYAPYQEAGAVFGYLHPTTPLFLVSSISVRNDQGYVSRNTDCAYLPLNPQLPTIPVCVLARVFGSSFFTEPRPAQQLFLTSYHAEEVCCTTYFLLLYKQTILPGACRRPCPVSTSFHNRYRKE
jgi:hypothetical protein